MSSEGVGAAVATECLAGVEPAALPCALACTSEVLALFGLVGEPDKDDCVTGVTVDPFLRLSAYRFLRADLFSGSGRSPAFDFFEGHFLA